VNECTSKRLFLPSLIDRWYERFRFQHINIIDVTTYYAAQNYFPNFVLQ
jgi:hypothetical protein